MAMRPGRRRKLEPGSEEASGAYAYTLYSPKEEQLGYGGLEWGTTFFPISSQIETFERYGWPKKVL